MQEAFLINPVRSRPRFKKFPSFKGLFSGTAVRVRKGYGRKRRKRAKSNPLGLNELMILNRPKKSKLRGAEMARRRNAKGRFVKASRSKRSRRVSKGVKRHRLLLLGRRISPRSRIARRMRGMRINPAILPPIMPLITEVVGVTAGFIGVKLIPKYIIPTTWQVGIMGTAVKLGSAIALSAVAGMVLRKPALQRAILVGGLLAVAVDVINSTGVLPLAGGSMGYLIPPERMGSYQVPEMELNADEVVDERY